MGPDGCVDVKPVVRTYDPVRGTTVFAGFGSVSVPPGLFDHAAQIRVDPTPAHRLPPPPALPVDRLTIVGDALDLQIRNPSTGALETGGAWNPPVLITLPVPDDVQLPDRDLTAGYHDGTAWQSILRLGTIEAGAPLPELQAAARDGFVLVKRGTFRQIVILTRHATPFAIFGRLGTGAPPIPTPPPVAAPNETETGENRGAPADGGDDETGGADSAEPPAQAPGGKSVSRRTTPRARRLVVRGGAPDLRARRGRVRFSCRVEAPARTCRAALTVRSGKRTIQLGRATAKLRKGETTVSLTLTDDARTRLAKARRAGLKVTLRLDALGPTGAVLSTASRAVRLRAA